MKLRHKQHRATASDNNLIPMINVVFLLLIFFMVAGNIRASDPAALKLPEATKGETVIAQSTLLVAADGTMMLNEAPVSMESLESALEDLPPSDIRYIPATEIPDQVLEDNRPNDRQPPLLAIKADAKVTIVQLRRIMQAAGNAGLSRVELLTEWVPPAAR